MEASSVFDLKARLKGIHAAAAALTQYYQAIAQIIASLDPLMVSHEWYRLPVVAYDPNAIFGGGYYPVLHQPEDFLVRYPGVVWVSRELATTTAKPPATGFTALAHVFSFGEVKYGVEEPEAWMFVLESLTPASNAKSMPYFVQDVWMGSLEPDRDLPPQEWSPPAGKKIAWAGTNADVVLHAYRVPLHRVEDRSSVGEELVAPLIARVRSAVRTTVG